MTDTRELRERLRSLADCDARAGEPLGKCMREAADALERADALAAKLERYREALPSLLADAELAAIIIDQFIREAGLDEENSWDERMQVAAECSQRLGRVRAALTPEDKASE